ncbi:hypothetical protein ACFGVR_18850 [Mucilaginibacter sp. AW1-3]
MKRILGLILLLCLSGGIKAQELYVNTEPASNMAAKAIGLRMNADFVPLNSRTGFRLGPEAMFGVSRSVMVHVNLYGSNYYQSDFKFEGASIYAKYRFLALDQPQSHFRMAGYGRVSLIDNPITFNEINLQGDNSGAMGGLVMTQLLHKLALSVTSDISRDWNNVSNSLPPDAARNQLGYTFSAGYLLLPKNYTDYKQTNLNIYAEFIGKSSLDGKGKYLDIAPSVQLIFNSRTRIDFGYHKQLTGDLSRIATTSYLIRLEHNLFNAF